MTILFIQMGFAGQDDGVNPKLGRMISTDILSVITAPGYLNNNPKTSGIVFSRGAFLFVNYNDGSGGVLSGMFAISIGINNVITLVVPSGGEGTVTDVTGNTNEISVANGTTTPVISIANNAIMPGTGALTLPSGTTAQRTAPSNGIRYNSQTGNYELYVASAWQIIDVASAAVTSITGTANEITASSSIGNVTLSIPTNPVFPGNSSAVSFTSNGDTSFQLTGTIGVTNGLEAITGVGTQFETQLGVAIKIAGVLYTVSNVTSNTTAVLSIPYAGTTASGLMAFTDEPFFTANSSTAVKVFQVQSNGLITSALGLESLTGVVVAANGFFTNQLAGPHLTDTSTYFQVNAPSINLNSNGTNTFTNTTTMTTPISTIIPGSVTVVHNSTAVTGISTNFNLYFEPFDQISFDGGLTSYQIQHINSNTSLTLTALYAGASAGGLSAYAASPPIVYTTPLGSSGMDGSGYFFVNESIAIPANITALTGKPMFGGITSQNTNTLMMLTSYFGNSNTPYVANLSARGNNASPTALVAGDTLIGISGAGYDGTNYIQATTMQMRVDGTVSTGIIPTRTDFFNTDTTGSYNAVFSLLNDNSIETLNNVLDDGNGQMAIGSTGPFYALDINNVGTGSGNTAIRMLQSASVPAAPGNAGDLVIWNNNGGFTLMTSAGGTPFLVTESGAGTFEGPLTIQQTSGTPATPSSGLTLFTNDGTTLKYVTSGAVVKTITAV